MPTPYNAAADLLRAGAAAAGPDALAVTGRQGSRTYAELEEEVGRLAGGLRRRGVRPEERVAMVALDSIEFVELFLACLRIGAIPVPLNPLLPGRDLGAIVAGSRARLAVVSEARVGEVEAIRAGAPEIEEMVVIGAPEWASLLQSDPAAYHDTWEDSPGFWLCTSGSTGTPKLAMHRHLDLRITADTYGAAVLGLGPSDRCFSVGPMFHAYGLGNSITFPFARGATTIVEPSRPPTPGLIREIVTQFRPTVFFCIPTVYAGLLASDLPDDTFASVRQGVSAAEPLPADTFHRFRERFGVEILDGIGSTEMAHIFISNRAGEVRAGTSGRPVPGYRVELRDDAGAPVDDDVAGHLHVGGDSMAAGYWCATDVTRRVFQGETMHTGDMYSRSADGYYTYLGRSDDMLRVGGEWVSPSEVEAVLIQHSSVLEVAVVAERDETGVQRPIAFVVAVGGEQVDPAALDELCRRELAGYKRPKHYEVLTELPKTATGKIQRYKLRRS